MEFLMPVKLQCIRDRLGAILVSTLHSYSENELPQVYLPNIAALLAVYIRDP